MKYKLIRKRNPSDPENYNKFHAIPVYNDLVSLKEISRYISKRSSLTSGDIVNVLTNLTEVLPEFLAEGKRVQLGDLGIFRLSFSSEGVDKESDFNVSKIRNTKIIFSPGKDMKNNIKNTRFKKE